MVFSTLAVVVAVVPFVVVVVVVLGVVVRSTDCTYTILDNLLILCGIIMDVGWIVGEEIGAVVSTPIEGVT